LRVVFLYVGTLFYGHVLGQLRRERARADRGFAWARGLEAKVAERTEELQRLYEECLAANRVKSEFIASMSHELLTPLHITMGYTEMLLDGDPGERARSAIRWWSASGRRRTPSSSSSMTSSTSAGSSRARCPSRSSPCTSPASSGTSSAASGCPSPRTSRCAGG